MSHNERPGEQEAVRTTIVGGRPPGSGQAVGPIPRGLEVLVKKAAVDPAFKRVLLEKRVKAADEIGLKLEPAEIAMLNAVPAAQLETIVASTKVTDLTRSAFLGRAAAVMLAALGVSTQGCSEAKPPMAGGVRPPPPPEPKPEPKPDPDQVTRGIRPDIPPMEEPKEEPKAEPPPPPPEPDPILMSRGVRPDIPLTKGIQPDEILPPGFGAEEIKKRVEAMVKLLASPEENTRVEAKQALLGMGPAILPALKEIKAPNADAEKDVQVIIQALEEKAKK